MSARLAVVAATAVLLGGAQVLPAAAADEAAPPPPAARVAPGTELVERRNAVSRTFATADPETFTTEIHARPIHFRDEQGRWQPIDPTLVPGTNGHVHSRANDMLVDIAPTTTGRLATVRFDGGTSVGFGLTGAEPMAPAVASDTATFHRVMPSVDVQLTSLARGLKETIVLHRSSAPATFVFPLHLENLTATVVDGSVVLRDGRGEVRGRIPRGWMVDSNIHPGSGEGVRSDAVTYHVAPGGPTGTTLRVSLDRAWLSDPARVYPVYVDPTVYNAGADDTYVMSPFTNDYSTETELKSGTFDEGMHRARSFIHFAGANQLDGKIINSATVKVYETWAFSCNARPVELKRVTESWSGGGLSSFPGWSLGTTIDSVSVARGYTGCANGPGYVDFEATDAMKNWAYDAWPNHGVALVAADEWDSYGWKRWASAQTSNDPRLSVNWSEPNGAPSIVTDRSVSPKACGTNTPVVTNDSRPVLTGSANDPDGDLMRIDFEVYQGHLSSTDSGGHAMPSGAPLVTSGSIGQKTSGSIANWSVWPALNDGNFSYRARAFDGNNYGVWSNGWIHFVVDVTPPGTPSVSSPTHPSQSTWYRANSPTFSFSASSESGIGGYSYVIDRTSTTEPDYVSEGAGSTASFSGLQDGVWYFHVRAQSKACGWGPKRTYAFKIDSTGPATAGNVWSPSHPVNTYSADQTVDMMWLPSSDNLSGLAGYAYAFNNSSTTAAGTVANLPSSATSVTSPGLADGTWWFHLRAIDGAGNVSADVAYGPIFINANKPAPPVISSSTHPSGKWSAARTAQFTWTAPGDANGIAGYGVVFSKSPGETPPTVVKTTTPQWTEYDVPDGFWYLNVAAVSKAGVWGTTATYGIKVDGTRPLPPVLASTSHPDSSVWYANDTVQVTATASALSGIVGYNYTILREPNLHTSAEINSASSSVSFMGLADGLWYVHARAISGSGLPSGVRILPVQIDRTKPSAPKVTSPSHSTTEATNQLVVTVDWASLPAFDAASGVAGYSVAFNNSATVPADSAVETTATRFSSNQLIDGVWYAHVRAVDHAGNVGDDVVYGPLRLDKHAPPVGADATNRFIALWQPRFSDEAFGRPYLAKPGYPPEILAEGFHDYNAEQKAYLGAALFTAIVTADPLPAEYSETVVNGVRELVTDFVFSKDELAAALDDHGSFADMVDRTASEVVHPLPEMLQAAQDLAGPLYDGVDLDLPELPDESYDELLDDFEDMEQSEEIDVTSELDPESTALLDAVDNGLEDAVADVENELGTIAAEAANEVDESPIFDVLPQLPVSVDYQLCWKSASDRNCKEGILAAPVPVDVTGDGTNDLLVTFGPSAEVVQPGVLAFGYTVTRFPLDSDTSGKPVRAHVWVNYDVGLLGKRFLVGYDGFNRGTALSETTRGTISLPDPTRVMAGDLVFNYNIDHTTPGARWALTAGLRNLTGAPEPREANLQFAPPTDANGTVDLTRSEPGDGTTTEITDVTYNSDRPTTFDGLYNTRDASKSTASRLVLDQLPVRAHGRIERYESADGATRVRFLGETSARIGRAVYTSVTRRDSNNQTTRVTTDVRDTPKDFDFELWRNDGRFSADYEAGALEKPDRIAIAYSRRLDGTLQRAVTGRATKVPAQVTASFGRSEQPGDDRLLLSYTGSDVVPFAAFSGFDRAAAVTITASAHDIPTLVTASGSAVNKSARLSASQPIGLLKLTGSRNGAKILRRDPEHATLISDGDKLGVSVRVSGLVDVDGRFGNAVNDVMTGTADFVPGGQRFVLAGRIGGSVGSVDISNLPRHLELLVDREALTAHFETSRSVDRVSFFATRRPGGPIVEGRLLDLPTTVDVKASLGDTTWVEYRSDARLGDARVMFSNDLRPGDKTGVTVRSHANDVPTAVDVRYNRSDRIAKFDANAAVGLVEATLSKGGAKAQRFPGDHVSFNGSPLAFAASARVHGLKSVFADYKGGVEDTTASLSVQPSGRSFVVNGALGDDRVFARVSNLPGNVVVTLNGLRDMTYRADARVDRVEGYKSRAGSGPTFQAVVRNAPTAVDVAAVLDDPAYRFRYNGSQGADHVRVYYSPRFVRHRGESREQFASGFVDQPPAAATVEANTAKGELDYRASGAAGGARLAVKGLFGPRLVLEAVTRDIPAQFQVVRTPNETSFVPAAGSSVGFVKFRASNTGTPANRPGNHLFVRTSKESDTFNVSVEATNVGALRYEKAREGVVLAGDVNLGGRPFAVDARLDSPAPDSGSNADEYRVAARGTISQLPSHVSFARAGDRIVYDASASLKANNLDVSIGWVKALDDTPRPPGRDGVSVTDGLCRGTGCDPTTLDGTVKGFCDAERDICKAVKVRFDWDGLGRGLEVHLDRRGRILDLAPVSPSGRRLQVRVDLDDVIKDALFVDLTQEGIDAGTGLHFGPIYVDRIDGALGLVVETDHTHPMGRLLVDARAKDNSFTTGETKYSDWRGTARVSNVPAKMALKVRTGGESGGRLVLSQGIGEIAVHASATVSREQFAGGWAPDPEPARGRVVLRQVPAAGEHHPITFTLNSRSDPGDDEDISALPGFRYSAPAGTADMGVHIDARLQRFQVGDVASIVVEGVHAAFRDLGEEVVVGYGDGRLRVSSPQTTTGEVYFRVGLDVDVLFDGTKNFYFPPQPWDAGRLEVKGHVELDISAPRVSVTLRDIRSMTITAGTGYIAYGIQGEYGTFALNAPGIRVVSDSWVNLDARIRPYNWLMQIAERKFVLDGTFNAVYGHVGKRDVNGDTGLCLDIGVGVLSGSARLYTTPAGTPTQRRELNGVTVRGADGDQVFSFVDPYVPGSDMPEWIPAVVDVFTAWVSDPFDNGSVSLPSHAWRFPSEC